MVKNMVKNMVKFCPNCGVKNFDDTRLCMKCNANIKKVMQQPLETEETKPKQLRDEFHGLQPMGYTSQPWQGRNYSKLGLYFALSYFVVLFTSLFLYQLPSLLFFVLSIPVIILGVVGFINGDKIIGKFTIVVGIIVVLLTLVFLIL